MIIFAYHMHAPRTSAAPLSKLSGNNDISFLPVNQSMRQSGKAHKDVVSFQPLLRKDYCTFMGGVDRADQRNSYTCPDHKAYNHFWRRVMEGKMVQCMTNTFIIFKCLVERWRSEATARLETANGEERDKLEVALSAFGKLARKERASWDELVSNKLMARCNIGSLKGSGWRFNRKYSPYSLNPPRVWGTVRVKMARLCMNPTCKKRTLKGCSCTTCLSAGLGGVLICKECCLDDASHERAARAAGLGVAGRRERKTIVWQS